MSKKKILSFFKRRTAVTTSALPIDSLQKSPDSRTSLLHTTCETLPLSAFINALCDDNKSGLIISGQPSQADIDAAWFSVYAQYIDLSLNADIKYSLRLTNEELHLKSKLMRIDLCVKGLLMLIQNNMQDDELVNILKNDYNFRYAYDWNNLESFLRDLNAVVSRSQKWDIQAQLKRTEIEAYEAKTKGEKPDRIYFTTILIRLSDHAGFRINSDTLSTAEFAIRKQDYINHIEQVNIQKQQQKQHGRKR